MSSLHINLLSLSETDKTIKADELQSKCLHTITIIPHNQACTHARMHKCAVNHPNQSTPKQQANTNDT